MTVSGVKQSISGVMSLCSDVIQSVCSDVSRSDVSRSDVSHSVVLTSVVVAVAIFRRYQSIKVVVVMRWWS